MFRCLWLVVTNFIKRLLADALYAFAVQLHKGVAA